MTIQTALAAVRAIGQTYASQRAACPATLPEPGRPRRSYNYQAVLSFIIQYKLAHDGNSPTFREIMDGCNVSSTSVVRHILKHLEHEGAITLSGHRLWTHISVTGGQWHYNP